MLTTNKCIENKYNNSKFIFNKVIKLRINKPKQTRLNFPQQTTKTLSRKRSLTVMEKMAIDRLLKKIQAPYCQNNKEKMHKKGRQKRQGYISVQREIQNNKISLRPLQCRKIYSRVNTINAFQRQTAQHRDKSLQIKNSQSLKIIQKPNTKKQGRFCCNSVYKRDMVGKTERYDSSKDQIGNQCPVFSVKIIPFVNKIASIRLKSYQINNNHNFKRPKDINHCTKTEFSYVQKQKDLKGWRQQNSFQQQFQQSDILFH